MGKKFKTALYLSAVCTVLCVVLTATKSFYFTVLQFTAPIAATVTTILFLLYPRKVSEEKEELEGTREVLSAVKKILVLAAAFLLIWGGYFAFSILDLRERRTEVISPQGTNTIILEYDLMSRPYVAQRKFGIFMKALPLERKSGYMQTKNADIVWLSETQFQVSIDGEVLGTVEIPAKKS